MIRFLLAASALLLFADAATADTITVGSLTLGNDKCIKDVHAYCGSLERPLDPAGRVPGSISIAFEFYPHTDTTQPGLGAIVAQEGGPGYSTTGSRDGYVRLFKPLNDRRDVILIDKRGTGFSGAIDCPALQKGKSADGARKCGVQLGDTAWLYGSALAADDVAAVLNALGTGPVDYYGDSYGTFFGEVLAVRHPELVRTMVLDSAYPAAGAEPTSSSEIKNGPTAFEIVCARTPACAAQGGKASARFRTLLDALRAHPVSGIAPGANGEMLNVTANAGALFTIVAAAGNNFTAYRDIDAAGRALIEANDARPLLRLVAEATDSEGGDGAPTAFSDGLELAVICADYRQPYDMHASEAERLAQYRQAIANANPDIFFPFTLAEATGAPTNPVALDECTGWLPAPAWTTPGDPLPPHPQYPHLPVLVLSGELDTITSPSEGRETAALFPNATFIETPNTVHESAIGNGGNNVPPFGGDLARCVGPMVLSFVASGGTPPDQSCLASIRPVRAVPAFAVSWRDVAPANAAPGNAGGDDALRLASAVTETVGDAFARYGVTSERTLGLRGGHFSVVSTKTGQSFKLVKLRWTADCSVTGTIAWNQLTGAVSANVTFQAQKHAGSVAIIWNDRETSAQAAITGTIDGAKVSASRIAP